MRTLLLIALASTLAACAGGPGNFDGTVAGNKLDVKDAIFFVQPFTYNGTSLGSVVAFGLASQTGSCDSLKANTATKNSAALTAALTVFEGGLAISDNLTDGSYRLFSPVDAINPPPQGTRVFYGAFDQLDATCTDTTSQTGLATSGSITVSSYTAGKTLSGSFDLQFGNDSGTGSFNATFCDYTPPTTPVTATCP